MAGRARYPLEAARTLRADEENAAKDALALRMSEQQAAEEAVTRAEVRLAQHREDTARTAAAENAADQNGRAVEEALRAGDWLKRRRLEAQALGTAVSEARRAQLAAVAASEEARTSLAAARAAREAVERHHATWLAAEKRAEEGRAEAEVEDIMAGRRRS